MKIVPCHSYEEMSLMASDDILRELQKVPSCWFCTATGESPVGTYQHLVKKYKENPAPFQELGIIKLDEWGGIAPDTPGSCEAYLHAQLLQPLKVPGARYISFQGDARYPGKECERVEQQIQRYGPIAICILGLGRNGHLGLNEPARKLSPFCHVSSLSPESKSHSMLHDMPKKPTHGLTVGMAAILQSCRIILLVTGTEKSEVFRALQLQKIDSNLPASFLWLHRDVTCYLDTSSVAYPM